MGSQKLFSIKDFLINFFGNISSNKFSIKLPNHPSCSMHMFYKGRLQSFTMAEKKFSTLELFAKSPPIWRGLLQKCFKIENNRKVSCSFETPTHAACFFQYQDLPSDFLRYIGLSINDLLRIVLTCLWTSNSPRHRFPQPRRCAASMILGCPRTPLSRIIPLL